MRTGDPVPALFIKTHSTDEIKTAIVPVEHIHKCSGWNRARYLILMLLRNLLASASEQVVFWSQMTMPCQTRLP